MGRIQADIQTKQRLTVLEEKLGVKMKRDAGVAYNKLGEGSVQ